MTDVDVTLGRHDERLCDIEKRQDKMEIVLSKIYFALVAIGGGVIMSLILLIMQMKAGA